MKVTYFRHGHSFHNEVFEKTRDENCFFDPKLTYSSLTEEGRKECAKRALDIDLEDFQVVLTSSLPRTLQTTEILFGDKNVLIMVTDLLRENDLEHTCNTREDLSKIKEKYPHFDTSLMYSEKDDLDCQSNCFLYRTRKIEEFLDRFSRDGFKKVALVTHNDFITHHLGIHQEIQHCGRIDTIFTPI